MTVVITYLASDNARNRRRQRRAEAAAKQQSEQQIDRLLTKAVARCNDRVLKAVSAPSVREGVESGAMCLPDVAIYSAGYRKSKEIVTARS